MLETKTARLLIVDDEPALCELLTDALAELDVEIATAASAHEAFAAARNGVDMLVTDLCLGDGTGLDVIDHVRRVAGDIPTVVITGKADHSHLQETARRRPVEFLTKPLDLPRLQAAVRAELDRRQRWHRKQHRIRRLRRLARNTNLDKKLAVRQFETVCADLTGAYRDVSRQATLQKTVITYQQALLTAANDDDVFRMLFRTLISNSDPVAGVVLICDNDAQLQIIGRFGVPAPDNVRFCELLTRPIVDATIAKPACQLIDAGEQADAFDPAIRKYLAGVSILSMPLVTAPGEMIGLVVLYRKGEQPFTDADVALAETLAPSTALAVLRNGR